MLNHQKSNLPDQSLRARWSIIEPGCEWIKERAFDWDRSHDGAQLVKRSRTRRVFSFKRQGEIYYVKRYRPRTFMRRLENTLVGCKGWREWRILNRCLQRGIRAPRPLAYGRSSNLLHLESYLLLGNVKGKSLHQALCENGEGRDLLRAGGKFARQLHDGGFFHADLKTQHLFLDGDGAGECDFTLIDLDGSRFPLLFLAERKGHNLAQLFKSLPPSLLDWTAAEAIYDGYCAAGPTPAVGRFFYRKATRFLKRQSPC